MKDILEEEREATQKRIKRRGYVCKVFPQGDGECVLASTDPREGIALAMDELTFELENAWRRMSSTGRRLGGSRGWKVAIVEDKASSDRTFLGLSGLPMTKHQEVLTDILGEQAPVVDDDKWVAYVPDHEVQRHIIEALRVVSPEELALRRENWMNYNKLRKIPATLSEEAKAALTRPSAHDFELRSRQS